MNRERKAREERWRERGGGEGCVCVGGGGLDKWKGREGNEEKERDSIQCVKWFRLFLLLLEIKSDMKRLRGRTRGCVKVHCVPSSGEAYVLTYAYGLL